MISDAIARPECTKSSSSSALLGCKVRSDIPWSDAYWSSFPDFDALAFTFLQSGPFYLHLARVSLLISVKIQQEVLDFP